MTIYNSTYSWPLYNNANTNYCYYYHILVYVYKQALYISIQSFVYNDKMFWMYTGMWKENDKKTHKNSTWSNLIQ